MNQQLELGQSPVPTLEYRDIKWLEEILLQAKDWMTAQEILNSINRAGEDHKRWLRLLASSSEKIVPGQKGYKHINHATEDEVSHAANTLDSQAGKMRDRATALRRNCPRKTV